MNTNELINQIQGKSPEELQAFALQLATCQYCIGIEAIFKALPTAQSKEAFLDHHRMVAASIMLAWGQLPLPEKKSWNEPIKTLLDLINKLEITQKP
jgi:hypothetical protein